MNTEIQFYGADWCPDCRRAKSFLKENGVDFTFIDVDLDQAATAKVEAINKGKRIIPTLIINDKPYTNPNNDTLAQILGINESGQVLLYGADWCPDCRRAKNYLQDNGIYFQFIDVDQFDWAAEAVMNINDGKRIIPTILIDDTPHTNPNNAVLAKLLDIDRQKEHKLYDSIIIGGGAAGLTTAIYAQRDRFDTLILEKTAIGGNAFLTEKIENYPGFTTISGPKLMERMEEQAKFYGATIKTGEEVKSIQKKGEHFQVTTPIGTFLGKSIVLATGSTYRRLNIPNETELIGVGIHFCATCDGAFYRDQEVIVIGGGNSAVEEGIFLSGFCKKVKIISINDHFTASETYLEKLTSIENIETHFNKESIGFLSNEEGGFHGVQLKDTQTDEESVLTADGAFIFIGLIPNTTSFKDTVALNKRGFITTTGLAETSVSGIFAAGDCREGAIAQVAAATGEGVLAAYGIRAYLK